MKLIGKYLESERIRKKFSLQDISNELKISEYILKKIENDNFPNNINNVFLIGHIKTYAKFLDLNYIEIIENFKIQTSYNDSNIDKKISKPIQTLSFFSFPKTISFISFLIIANSFYFLFLHKNNLNTKYAMTPDVPENLQYSIEKTEMNINLSNNLEISKVEKKSNKNNLIEEDQLLNSSSVIASLPNKKTLEYENNKITLKFLNSTWIQLRDENDNIIISKLMSEGEEYSYSSSDNLNLTAGNAGDIVILVNGVIKGKAGKAGEIIDSLIIDNILKN